MNPSTHGMLLGSRELPSSVYVGGQSMSLGDLVRSAVLHANVTDEEWNKLDSDSREVLLRAHLRYLRRLETIKLTRIQEKADLRPPDGKTQSASAYVPTGPEAPVEAKLPEPTFSILWADLPEYETNSPNNVESTVIARRLAKALLGPRPTYDTRALCLPGFAGQDWETLLAGKAKAARMFFALKRPNNRTIDIYETIPLRVAEIEDPRAGNTRGS